MTKRGNRFVDISGRRFGLLTVLEVSSEVNVNNRHIRWLCRCDCGTVKTADGTELRSGHVVSCGCRKRVAGGEARRKHRMSNHPLYVVWGHMLRRCYNRSYRRYKDWGGRGIRIDDIWRKDNREFFRWALANGYRRGLQIERRDNDGNYSPGNCYWATPREQASNTRRNVFMEYQGKKATAAEWSRVLGIKAATIYNRIHSGWPPARIVSVSPSIGNNQFLGAV